MTSYTKHPNSRNGAALIVTAILIAAIGILLGIGRLTHYRNQCVRRFDRQKEIDRMLATRSALRYVPFKIDPDDGNYLDLFRNGATFEYMTFSSHGAKHKIEVQLAPQPPELHSDLCSGSGWTEVCLNGGQFVAPDVQDRTGTKRASFFEASTVRVGEGWCFLGRTLPVSWLDFPWGLRYLLDFGSFLGTGNNQPHTETRCCLLIVGGSLPSGMGPCIQDIECNPVIRVECTFLEDADSQITAFYSPMGITSATEYPLTACPVSPASFEHDFGIQLSGAKAAIFQRVSVLYAPTLMEYGSLPAGSEIQFSEHPRLYVGARQITATNMPVKYSIVYADVRQPFDWNVVLSWESRGLREAKTSTVVHAAARATGGQGTPELAVTYDTHGTDRWPVKRH